MTFSTLQYHLLLVRWEVYLENIGYSEGNFVTKGDLIDKIRSYDVQLTRTEFNAAFRLFKKYSLINFNDDEGGRGHDDTALSLVAIRLGSSAVSDCSAGIPER